MMARPSAGWLGTTWTEGTWQMSPTFTGLTEGTTYRFYQRIKETTTTKASSKSAALEAKPEVHVEPVDISGSVTVSLLPTIYPSPINGTEAPHL